MDKRYATGKLRLEGDWTSLRAQLSEIAQNDALAEIEVAASNKVGCFGILLILLSLIIIHFSISIGITLLIIGIFVAITGFMRRNAASKYDLENMRYQLPTQFLDKLAVDLDPERPISLMLDFRASNSPQFVQKTQQSKLLCFTYGPKVSYFNHLWLELQATTQDGHRLKLNITRKGSFKEKPKRKRVKTRLRYHDIVRSVVCPASGSQWSAAEPDRPTRSGVGNFKGKITQRGVAAKAVGPNCSVISSRGNAGSVSFSSGSQSGSNLQALDVISVFIACFRGLANISQPLPDNLDSLSR